MQLPLSQRYYVLVDCNNFFASAETIFNPKLLAKPVVVLSNNDGCVIARSAEAKKLSIPMGVPYFKIRDFCLRKGVKVLSSNFQLYGNISARVMSILSEFSPDIEIYSIDEAFLSFPASIPMEGMLDLCHQIRQRVKKWVGIPISLGIAPTKMLAKLANSCAKKLPNGVMELCSPETQEKILKETPVDDLWGIGRRLSKQLWICGMESAWHLRQAKTEVIRKKFGVVGERWVYELRGVSCLPLEEAQAKKSITCSRSFGNTLTDMNSLMEGMAYFTARACEKLRGQDSVAQTVSIFLAQSDPKPKDSYSCPFLYTSTFLPLPFPTADTAEVLKVVREGVGSLFRFNTPYRKGGIILSGLAAKETQHSLFQLEDSPKRCSLLDAIDSVNRKHGSQALQFATALGNERWRGKSSWQSSAPLGSWNNLPIVRA